MTCSTTRDRLIHRQRNVQVINTHIFNDTRRRPQIHLPEVYGLFWGVGGDTCSKKTLSLARKDKHTLICVYVCVRETEFIWSPRRGWSQINIKMNLSFLGTFPLKWISHTQEFMHRNYVGSLRAWSNTDGSVLTMCTSVFFFYMHHAVPMSVGKCEHM